MKNIEQLNKIESGLLGFAVGDAMGVPIEFTSRFSHVAKPLTEMVGFGSHRVPAGTWSDDTSMTIAAMDSIAEVGYVDYDDIMKRYCEWAFGAKYTATDTVFDIGNGTLKALSSYRNRRTSALESGGKQDFNNGNGSLMRMLPIVYYLYYKDIQEPEYTDIIHSYSSLTHGHSVSKMACHIYCDFMISLLDGNSREDALNHIKNIDYTSLYDQNVVSRFGRILKDNIYDYSLSDISSSGYVVDTLEASIWTIFHTDNYEDAIVKSINMGDDTDTVGAITGSMAGVLYGKDAIPTRWSSKLIRKEYLEDISNKFKKIFTEKKIENNRFNDTSSFNHDSELYEMLLSEMKKKKQNNQK